MRLIPIARGEWPAGVPQHDYWLFDDERLWLIDYDPVGSFEAARLVDDQVTVARHRRWRDAALAASVPLADYSGARPGGPRRRVSGWRPVSGPRRQAPRWRSGA